MKVAVCVIVRDEQRDLAEWLAYQRAVGFDAVVAYDNCSTDATPLILRRAADVFDVRPIYWDSSDDRSQFDAYENCLTKYGSEFDWIAFLDSDEYIVPHDHATVGAFLEGHSPETGLVAVHWAIYGSSGIVDFPSDLLIESFLRRAPTAFAANGHVKSIVRPNRIAKAINPHLFETDGLVVLANGAPVVDWFQPGVTKATATHAVCQINHYFVRSKAHWDRKRSRGRFNGAPRSDEDFIYNDRNDVEDRCALRFAKEVHATIKAIASAHGAERAGLTTPRRAMMPQLRDMPILYKERLPLCSSIEQLRSIPIGTFVAHEAVPRRLHRPDVTFTGDARRARPTIPNFLDEWNPGELFPLHSPGHAVHLSRLPMAACFRNGIIVSEDGKIFSESFRHLERRAHRVGIRAAGETFSVVDAPHNPSFVSGRCLFVDGEHFGGFGHLLGEIITRLWAVAALGEVSSWTIICGSAAPDRFLPMLTPFGILPEKVVSNEGSIVCEDLWVPTQGAIVRKSVSTAARAAWRTIAGYYAGPSPIAAKDVYVSRSGQRARRLLNEDWVENAFAKRGFAVVRPEKLSFPDQVRLFAHAKRLAGCAGSAMFNLVFAGADQEQMLLTSDAYVVHNEPLLTRSTSTLSYVLGTATDLNDPASDWMLAPSAFEAAVDDWLDRGTHGRN